MSSFQNKCYGCAHSREILYSHHRECVHPGRYREMPHFISRIMNSGVGSSLAGQEASRLGPSKAATGARPPLNIQASTHAISSGWFGWPINYDPVWLQNCDGFVDND